MYIHEKRYLSYEGGEFCPKSYFHAECCKQRIASSVLQAAFCKLRAIPQSRVLRGCMTSSITLFFVGGGDGGGVKAAPLSDSLDSRTAANAADATVRKYHRYSW